MLSWPGLVNRSCLAGTVVGRLVPMVQLRPWAPAIEEQATDYCPAQDLQQQQLQSSRGADWGSPCSGAASAACSRRSSSLAAHHSSSSTKQEQSSYKVGQQQQQPHSRGQRATYMYIQHTVVHCKIKNSCTNKGQRPNNFLKIYFIQFLKVECLQSR